MGGWEVGIPSVETVITPLVELKVIVHLCCVKILNPLVGLKICKVNFRFKISSPLVELSLTFHFIFLEILIPSSRFSQKL